MSSSASVLAAATTLVDWAHKRRRRWTDEPLRPLRTQQILEVPEVLGVPEVLEVLEVLEVPEVHQVQDDAPPAIFVASEPIQDVPQIPYFAQTLDAPAVVESAPLEAFEIPDTPFPPEPFTSEVPPAIESPMAVDATRDNAPDDAAAEPLLHDVAHHNRWADLGGRGVGALRMSSSIAASAGSHLGSFALKAASMLGDVAKASLDRVGPWGDVALWILTRGAALASTASVIMLLTLHRGELVTVNRAALFSRWNQLTETVAAAAAVTHPAPPPPVPLPAGSGRLIVTSSDDGPSPTVLIDGKPLGAAPVTVILPAGAHRLVVRGLKGSVERSVRVEAGETIDVKEEIYPGWVAVASAIDLTFKENGRTLKRDERGWAILPPGPHDIHLDNDQLGIHETRHIVVTPGDATHISLAPPASTLSITANEPAEVWVDGSSLGEAPITDAPMKLGMHDVRVRSASHERWLRVRVTTQPMQLNVDLTAE